MVSQARNDAQFTEYDELDRFEKIGRRSEWGMPSRRATSVKRALRRTAASRRAGRRISATSGGKHLRRNHTFR